MSDTQKQDATARLSGMVGHINPMLREGASVLLSIDWEPDRIALEDGVYGCDSGCEYVRVYACQGERQEELFGSFWMSTDKGVRRAVWQLADLLGVKAYIRDWTTDDEPRLLPRPESADGN